MYGSKLATIADAIAAAAAARVRAECDQGRGDDEPGLVFECDGHDTLVQLMRAAELIDVEQLGRERVAPVMPLTFVRIDVHSHTVTVLRH